MPPVLEIPSVSRESEKILKIIYIAKKMASKYAFFAGVRKAVKQLLMETAVTWWRSSHKYSWQPSSCIILHQLSSGTLHLSQGSAPF
jgi:hypothetical protein